MDPSEPEPLLRVMALRSLTYCERLFYLEEVEEIRLADEAVYAGRQLHQQWANDDPAGAERHSIPVESAELGLSGVIDALRTREGALIPYEHKRGRAHRERSGSLSAWPSDRVQVAAYAMLLKKSRGIAIVEGRVRYHADNTTVRIAIDSGLHKSVLEAIERAKRLRALPARPPIIEEPRKCAKCSLAPVCLPEEERFAHGGSEPSRLFPEASERETLHVTQPGATVRRAGDRLTVTLEKEELASFPVRDIGAVVLHGAAQLTTQALHLAVDQDVGVHWMTSGGRYIGGLAPTAGGVHRRLRQFQALTEPGTALRLARKLGAARAASQIRFILRATRGDPSRRAAVASAVTAMRAEAGAISSAEGVASVRGHEGVAARHYFATLPLLLSESTRQEFAPAGRSRRPPRDRFNAALSFGYALLYSRMLGAVIAVGLDPAFGFFHTPRSASYPLVLDLMELFRVPIVDMPLVAAINRRHWVAADFSETKERTWLSESGRRKAITIFEERLQESWRHPVLDYSLSYGRMLELETRLLEKEWTGSPGLFARMKLR